MFIFAYLLLFQINNSTNFMSLSPFERSEKCKIITSQTNFDDKTKSFINKKLPLSQINAIRNYLEIKGIKPPSPSGWFAPPRVYISINEARKSKSQNKKILNILLSAPFFSDPKKNEGFKTTIIKGCMLKALYKNNDANIPIFLLDVAFNASTMIFRQDITKALQNMGSFVVLTFLPLSKIKVSKTKDPLKYYKKRYAKYILSSSVFGTPKLALQNADDSLKLQLMELYGKYNETQAIYPLLNYAKTAKNELKYTARQAILKFFKTKQKNKIGIIKKHGGVEVTSIISLSPRLQAYHAVKETLEKETRGDYDRTLYGIKMAKLLFEFWDKKEQNKWLNMYAKAYSLFKQGNIIEAVQKYKKILAHSPGIHRKELMFDGFVSMAILKLKKHKVNKALEYLYFANQVQQNKTISSTIHYLRGLQEEAAGNIPHAIHQYKTALFLNPQNYWAKAAVSHLSPYSPPIREIEKSIILITGLSIFLLIIIFFTTRKLNV